MSPLTKLFVILMIVCSLLLTGGVVVFVNRVEDYRIALNAKEAEVKRLQEERNAAQNLATSTQEREKDQARQLNSKVQELIGEIQKLGGQIASDGVEKGQLKNQVAAKDVQLTVAGQTNQTTNQNLKDVQTRYDAVVKENDQVRVRNTELASINTDYLKRLDEAERERRWLNEQVVQLKSENDRFKKVMADKNITLESPLANPPAEIKGVVKAVRVVDGMPFATISLGSADRIAKDMTFIVVNQNNSQFLANIKITSVETNEAFGRLEGPAAKDVASGNVVLSRNGL